MSGGGGMVLEGPVQTDYFPTCFPSILAVEKALSTLFVGQRMRIFAMRVNGLQSAGGPGGGGLCVVGNTTGRHNVHCIGTFIS